MGDSLAGFQAAMRERGLEPPAEIVPGKLHRFPSNGKRGDDAGWCKLFEDGRGGVFGDHRSGLSETWQERQERPFAPSEREAFIRQCEDARREREEADARRQAEAATKAAEIWKASEPAPEDHPYLKRKGVKPHSIRQQGGRLVIPARAGADLHSLQFVTGEGDKRFLTGGRVGGCYHAIGKPEAVLCIAEGYATAATIHEATGYAVAVAFDAGNLEPVALALRAKYPDLELVLCADDDAATTGNPGITKAAAAARAVGGLLAVPRFGPNRPDGVSDFNDLAKLQGPEDVRACIKARERMVAAQAMPPSEPARHHAIEGAAEWPEPMPLNAETHSEPYPLDALPGVIGEAVREVVGFVQCPDALAACSALSAVSLALQGLADVQRAEGLSGPCSLYLLAIAESGERKTTCDGHFLSAVREWEAEQTDVMAPEVAKHAAALKAWEAKRKGVLGKIEALSSKGSETETEERALADLEQERPPAVRVPRLIFGDTTPEALAWRLASGWPSAGVMSSEAGIVFGGHGMKSDSQLRSLALLNVLWEGGTQAVDRRQSESFTLRGARLSMGLAAQLDTARAFFEATKGLARGSGFAARFLIAWPGSTQGTRLYREAPVNWPRRSAFHRRIFELLSIPLSLSDSGELSPPIIRLSAPAREIWADFHDEVEREQGIGGDMEQVRDVASKSADNAARLAALFHVFEKGPAGEVGADHMRAGARIAAWHLYESRRFLGTLALPLASVNAGKLDAWLLRQCREAGADSIPTREVLQRGPGALRGANALDEAIAELRRAGRAQDRKEGKRRRIYVNPALLSGDGYGA